VSFAAPLVLIALVAIPVLIVLYGGVQRDRRRAAAAFAAPKLAASVTPRRPGWRRHAPMLVVLLAIAALVLAAAKPQRSVAVPVERASIMLVTDVSGSMQATDVKPTRLEAARAAARRFVREVPKGVNVGVMALSSKPRVLASPTTDRDAINAAITQLAPRGGTGTGEAIQAATRILSRTPTVRGKRPPAAIVVISDGKSTGDVDPVAAATRRDPVGAQRAEEEIGARRADDAPGGGRSGEDERDPDCREQPRQFQIAPSGGPPPSRSGAMNG
jgi:Ca-activated chloride channel family protein